MSKRRKKWANKHREYEEEYEYEAQDRYPVALVGAAQANSPMAQGNPTISFYGEIPTIFITPRAFGDMRFLIDESKDEISWLGSVKEITGGLLIDEIFLPKQECSAAYTEMQESGLQALAEDLLRRKDGPEIWNQIRFWGHSHVNMGVFASTTDDNQMDLFKTRDERTGKYVHEWFLRGIFNKHGKVRFWLFMFEKGVVIDDVPWTIKVDAVESRKDSWRQLMKARVSARLYAYRGPYGGGHDYDAEFGWRKPWPEEGEGGFPVVPVKEEEDGNRHDPTLLAVRPRSIRGPTGNSGGNGSGGKQVSTWVGQTGHPADLRV